MFLLLYETIVILSKFITFVVQCRTLSIESPLLRLKGMENFHRMDACPVRDVLSRLGDKWTMLVLVTLKANGTMRFCDIQKTIGDISQRMLTVTLRSLETDGLIVRKVYAEVPPRVEYNLTETGCSLMPHIESLVGWALEHMNDILNRRSLQN